MVKYVREILEDEVEYELLEVSDNLNIKSQPFMWEPIVMTGSQALTDGIYGQAWQVSTALGNTALVDLSGGIYQASPWSLAIWVRPLWSSASHTARNYYQFIVADTADINEFFIKTDNTASPFNWQVVKNATTGNITNSTNDPHSVDDLLFFALTTNIGGTGTGYAYIGTPGDYYNEVNADSPVSYWRLGETLGSTAFDDNVGTGKDATYVGTPILGSTGALANDNDYSVGLDGSTEWMTVPFSASHNAANFSIECWVYFSSGIGSLISLVDNKGTNLIGYQLKKSAADKFIFQWGNGATSPSVTGTTTAVANTWYHIIGTYDGTNGRLYANGNLEGTTASGFTGVSAQQLVLGANIFLTQSVGGYLDEVAYYNTALSQARLLAHYDAGRQSKLRSATIAGAIGAPKKIYIGEAGGASEWADAYIEKIMYWDNKEMTSSQIETLAKAGYNFDYDATLTVDWEQLAARATGPSIPTLAELTETLTLSESNPLGGTGPNAILTNWETRLK